MITVNIHVLLRVYILVSYNLHQLFVYQVDVINRLYTCINKSAVLNYFDDDKYTIV